MAGDLLGHHRAHFLEHLAAFLTEQLIAAAHARGVGPVEEPEVVANVVGETGLQTRAQHFPLIVAGGVLGPLQNHRGTHVAENKVAVAVFPGQVPRADFRIDHQHAARGAVADGVDAGLDPKGRARAGHVHVIAPTVLHAQSLLHLHRHSRIGALHVGTGHQHRVQIVRLQAGAVQRLTGGVHGDLRLHRQLVVTAFGNIRRQPVRVENAFLVQNIALLNARRFLDERGVGAGQRLNIARFNGVGMAFVVAGHVFVEGSHQFFIGDGLFGGPESGTADNDGMGHKPVNYPDMTGPAQSRNGISPIRRRLTAARRPSSGR